MTNNLIIFILNSYIGPLRGWVVRLFALHCWGPEFLPLSLHMEFAVDESESGRFFLGLPFSPALKLSPLSPFSLIILHLCDGILGLDNPSLALPT